MHRKMGRIVCCCCMFWLDGWVLMTITHLLVFSDLWYQSLTAFASGYSQFHCALGLGCPFSFPECNAGYLPPPSFPGPHITCHSPWSASFSKLQIWIGFYKHSIETDTQPMYGTSQNTNQVVASSVPFHVGPDVFTRSIDFSNVAVFVAVLAAAVDIYASHAGGRKMQ